MVLFIELSCGAKTWEVVEEFNRGLKKKERWKCLILRLAAF